VGRRQRTQHQGDIIVFTLAVPSPPLILREFASFIFWGQMPKRRSVVPFSAPADLQLKKGDEPEGSAGNRLSCARPCPRHPAGNPVSAIPTGHWNYQLFVKVAPTLRPCRRRGHLAAALHAAEYGPGIHAAAPAALIGVTGHHCGLHCRFGSGKTGFLLNPASLSTLPRRLVGPHRRRPAPPRALCHDREPCPGAGVRSRF
jgi:hypothetical protein